MKKVCIAIVCLVLSLIAPTIYVVKSIQFDQQCGGFLKQASDANSVELAEKQLNIAVNYIEEKGLTSGYTSVIFRTEDENIGFWYENLKTCQKELAETKSNSTLENTNVLMKLRESLTDDSRDGTELTIPSGIFVYPNNGAFMLANSISVVLFLISLLLFALIWTEYENEEDEEEDEEDEEEEEEEKRN